MANDLAEQGFTVVSPTHLLVERLCSWCCDGSSPRFLCCCLQSMCLQAAVQVHQRACVHPSPMNAFPSLILVTGLLMGRFV